MMSHNTRIKLALGVPVAVAAEMALFAMLRRARQHPFGLTVSPPQAPAMLWSAGQGGLRRFTSVVLAYGRPLAATGPWTEVETCFSELECFLPVLEETLIRAELQGQAWARGDWLDEHAPFHPLPEAIHVPAGGSDRDERAVSVAGQERLVQVVSRGSYQALRFVQDSVVVTAVARLGFPDIPRFDVVEDLEPYLAEHRRFILSWLRFWESGADA